MRQRLCILGLSALLAACGGSDSSTGGPSAAASSVTVTLQVPTIAVTKTTNATGTATLTNGQTQSITTGWRSDVPTVATASDSGIVTGVATGRANIYVVSGGRQGQAQVRVVPNYQGQWRGTYVIRTCTQTGAVEAAGFCNVFRPNTVLPITMSLSQAAETVTGQFFLGTAAYFPATSQIREDGGVQLIAAQNSAGDIGNATGWDFNSTVDGRLIGIGLSIFQIAGQTGEGRLNLDVLDLNRISGGLTTRLSAPTLHLRSWEDAFRALGGH